MNKAGSSCGTRMEFYDYCWLFGIAVLELYFYFDGACIVVIHVLDLICDFLYPPSASVAYRTIEQDAV